MESPSVAATSTTPRDDIMKQIADHAASVRSTFEAAHPQRRKHVVSSANAAAAKHMAELNRKRKFKSYLDVRATQVSSSNSTSELLSNRTFHHLLPAFPMLDDKNSVRPMNATSSSSIITQWQWVNPKPRTTDGIVLKAYPEKITVSYNDVVCGRGKTTTSLVGNQRFKVWVNLHKGAFAKAPQEEDRRRIASKIVDAVTTSVPQGRFLSLDIASGFWYDVGYQRAVDVAMSTLVEETGMMKPHGVLTRRSPLDKGQATPRVFAAKSA